MSVLITITCFALLLTLTLLARQSLLRAAAAALLLATVLIVAVYGLSLPSLFTQLLHGCFTALEIGILLFGALLFFYRLQAAGFQQQLQHRLQTFAGQPVIVVLLLVFFFGSFLEGVSGFGTPAMMVAPLLLALRFPPVLAGSLPLLANTVPVLFGTVGTPVRIGLSETAATPLSLHAVAIMSLPLLALPFLLFRLLPAQQPLATTTSTAGLPVYSAGLAFLLPFAAMATTGPEFPTIVAAPAGVMLWWLGLYVLSGQASHYRLQAITPLLRTLLPYLLMAGGLLLARFALPAGGSVLRLPVVDFERKIGFFQPGILFLAGALLLHLATQKAYPVSLSSLVKQTARRLPVVLGTIACLAVMARLLGQYLTLTDLMPPGRSLSPFILAVLALCTGFAGSFMAGSATVSNLLFGSQWLQLSKQFSLSEPLILACQLSGAALGNALSMQNLAMVQAVLQEKGLEVQMLHRLWKPVTLLVLLTIAAIAMMLLTGAS